MRFLTVVLIAFAISGPVLAQDPGTVAGPPLDRAKDAYGDGRYAEAVSILDRLLLADPENAEAYYLRARVLIDEENPNRNPSSAGSDIDRALSRDPENVLYLVAKLESLREDTNFIFELINGRQRYVLANRILTIDSTNAFAHEELGISSIRDYYQYRNAISIPFAAFSGNAGNSSLDASETAKQQFDDPRGIIAVDPPTSPLRPTTDPLYQMTSSVQLSDRFDVAAMQERGLGVVSLSNRADAAYEVAIGNLQAALSADPRRRSIYDHVVRLATLSNRWSDALPDLGEMYVQYPEDPQMWLYTGLMNQRLGQYEAADISFRKALELMPDDERAAFTDLTLILPESEWPAFQANPDGFSQTYWTSRDPRFLNGVNERRTEHYARLTEAELLFSADDLRIPGWKSQRGRIWVRYGPPETDVMIDGSFAMVLEAFADRDVAFQQDEMVQRSSRFNVWDYDDEMRFVFEDVSRKNEFRLYSPPADLFGLRSAGTVSSMDYVLRTAETVRRTPERFDFEAPGRQIDLPYRITAFKGEEGSTDLYVNYGIPLETEPLQSDGDVDVTVKTGAFLIGPTRELLAQRRRTVYGLRQAQIVPFKEARLWTSTEYMNARPVGTHEVSLEFETSSGGTSAVQRRAVDIRDFSSDGLQLSDILLAYLIEEEDTPSPGRVVRNGLSVQPAPWGVFAVDDPIYLYVEIYGLGLTDGRTDYEVEATLQPKDMSRGIARLVRRVFGSRGRGVSSAFEGDGSQSDDYRDLILDASGQEPGYYTLTVTVRDKVSGKSTKQDTDLLLE